VTESGIVLPAGYTELLEYLKSGSSRSALACPG
jgi:hypothetical protein